MSRLGTLDVEGWLWIALPTINLLALHGWKLSSSHNNILLLGPSAWLCWIQCLMHPWLISNGRRQSAGWPTASVSSRPMVNEPSPTKTGNLMAMSLIPSLAHSLALISPSNPPSRWILHSKWTTLSAFAWLWMVNPSMQPVKLHPSFEKNRIFFAMLNIAVTIGFLYDPTGTAGQRSFSIGECLEWIVIHGLLSGQHSFFVKPNILKKTTMNEDNRKKEKRQMNFQMATWGEYQTLVFLMVIGLSEWQSSILFSRDDTRTMESNSPHLFYPLVAQSGILGCFLSVTLAAVLFRRRDRLFLPVLMAMQVVGPLGIVELCLRYQGYHAPASIVPLLLPRSLQWLLDFLLSTEPNSLSWPRFWGVLYWSAILVVLPAPTLWIIRQKNQSVVVTRKWFHLVAVVLFAPTTFYFPQLMALGYAVALCALMIFEILRHTTPVLNEFYRLVHDPTKDILSEGIVVSHICLILGCALPLWLAEAMKSSSILLSQWGILCLGVGDAMGAVIGKSYGRIRWGKNQRTVEGSLAMGVSMLIWGSIIVWFSKLDDWIPLVLATVFATLLEACTIQMDNLVLPLAGAVWLILFHRAK